MAQLTYVIWIMWITFDERKRRKRSRHTRWSFNASPAVVQRAFLGGAEPPSVSSEGSDVSVLSPSSPPESSWEPFVPSPYPASPTLYLPLPTELSPATTTHSGASYQPPREHLCPLREVANWEEGTVRVHVPFSTSDLPLYIEKVGNFSEDPGQFIDKFENQLWPIV